MLTLAAAGLLAGERAFAQTDYSSGPSSYGLAITKGNGQSSNQADDPIALKTPPKVGVELYVSVARLYIESGKFSEADDQFRQAMKMAPNDVRVLLGYAMLKDQMNQPEEALTFYKKAEQKHPKDPAVYNNLAIHYVRRGMVREAIEAGRRATDLRPREPRYRNNLAAIFVEAGMPQEAFKQLREVYDEPVSHYNLGFLLHKRGLKAAALQEFTLALQLRPGMSLARQWVERLSQRGEGNPATNGMASPPGQAPVVATFQPSAVPPALPAPPLPPYNSYGASAQVQMQYPSPTQVQYPAPGSTPAQFAASPLPDMPHYVRPQYAGPQYSGPPYQNSPPAATPAPVVAARDSQPTGVHMIPPAGDGDAARRLPPVNDPSSTMNSNRDPRFPEIVAPNPPELQR